MKKQPKYKFRLYVAGDAPNSAQAIANLRAVCEELLEESHEIELVDVLQHPERAVADHVFLTPTLVKLAPAPVRKVVGSLSQREPLLAALGLPTR